MSRHAVHWHEGMFLRPHHFQAAARHTADTFARQMSWSNHYSWGVRQIDIDEDALRNYRFVVRRLQARLRDGTVIDVPDDGPLAPLDLKPALEGRTEVTVALGVPEIQLGRPNAGTSEEGARYRVYTAEKLADENTGQSERALQFRALNAQLMTGDQDPAGYQTLKLAVIAKSSKAEAVPELAEAYIPPLLGCDGWKILTDRILTPVYDRLGQLVKQRAEQIRSRIITFDSPSPGDRQLLEGLRIMNQAFAQMGVTHFAEGVHPLPIYAELARVVGDLAIFGPEKEVPTLPRYDHDDLGRCFWTAKRYIDELLNQGSFDLGYVEQPFYGSGLRVQGDIKAEWLAPAWQMFVGVKAPLKAEECIQLLTGKLDMKIGAADRVDEIFRLGGRGLVFRYAQRPPRALPSYQDLTYFQIDRTVQPDEWQKVQATLKMAVRLNERLFAGNIEGQRTVTIKAESKLIPLAFTLYVVPPGLAEKT
ncbi:MAG: type VI secretion system baseplate subunit TssK [Gemmataceae bacterium]|nr:type VI secretion system baseplate subunit TssK [Gemmataceae bacterium]